MSQTSGNQDPFPILRIDHLEFYVSNAKQAAAFYRDFGFLATGYRGMETGSRDVTSYVLEQGRIRFVMSAATVREHPIAVHAHRHGDGVAIIALEVPDVSYAYEFTTRRGAQGVTPCTPLRDQHGELRYAEIQGYGDTIFKFVDRSSYQGVFAPGFDRKAVVEGKTHHGVGLAAIDHVVGNVELGAMDQWVSFFERTMGFALLQHFDDEAISTEYSALMSKVVQDGSGRIKFPINEPAQGRRRSQIQEYLDYYGGPGVQHVALITGDIISAVRELRSNGIEFLRVPATYYDDLEARVGKINEPLEELQQLGVLVDRDDEGYLLQIFTKPVEDIPTLFFEIIERHGSRGFGVGNFKSLFESLEREQELRGNL